MNKTGFEAASTIKGPSLADHVQEPVKADDEVLDPEEEETTSGGKKVRIPASRLTTLTKELKGLREQVAASQSYQERVAALEAQIAHKGEEELPDWWKDAYGEEEISKQGYKNQVRIMREEMKRALVEQDQARQAEDAERTAKQEAIEQSFDAQMDELEDSLGRALTASQKSELLDIVGEYSPQENGKYIAYMPVEKAYALWSKGHGTDAGKQEMARIAGIQSTGGGASTTTPERPQWGDWRKRFGN